jgi:hypothetical protein
MVMKAHSAFMSIKVKSLTVYQSTRCCISEDLNFVAYVKYSVLKNLTMNTALRMNYAISMKGEVESILMKCVRPVKK